jgi:hypothetical protein
MGAQPFARGGGAGRRAALHQNGADAILERAQPLRHRRGRHAQPGRRRLERAGAKNFRKRLQLARVERQSC